MADEKPPVLRKPKRLLILLAVLLAAFVLLYVGVGATGFLRSQETDARRPMDGAGQAPVEQANPPSG